MILVAFASCIGALVATTLGLVLLTLLIARRRTDALIERAAAADLAEGATDIPMFRRAA